MNEAGFVPSVPWVLPFAGLLLAIAVLPVLAPRLWDSNLRKFSLCAALATPVLLLYLAQRPASLLHTAHDYLSFIALLASLFVISGGVRLTGDLRATPAVNTAFLAVGALLASVVGTTGASMLLIRPLLDTNGERRHAVHTVVFFIFLVSNVGGCLTPLGDPPLFLGYLAGVPFTWTLRLAPAWLVANGLLLIVYHLWDRRAYASETLADLRRDARETRPLRIEGWGNLGLLAGVLVAVAWLATPWREATLVALAAASLAGTPADRRRANRFTFHPIVEVAVLFFGIFVTMLPALDLLRVRGAELGVREPWQFFWATGSLSSFLDNAPTYLSFLALAQGVAAERGLPADVVGVPHELLAAVSLGAVFMGANTYIGNGPNFMVRAIAEERGLRMPSFGGYLLYSAAVLLPLFFLITLMFFR